MKYRFLILAAMAFLLSEWTPAIGQQTALGDYDSWIVSGLTENDAFFSGTDRNYTNGLKLSLTVPERLTPDLLRDTADWVLGRNNQRMISSFSVGHSIFTPEDISAVGPLPGQHPYAGWLYVGTAVTAFTDRLADTLAIEVGLVGPDAGGRVVQTEFHRLIDGQKPRGWDNQLRNEPGLLLSWERRWIGNKLTWQALEMDMTPSAGISLGNIQTSATGGLSFRLGQGLDGDPFGPPRIRPSLSGPNTITRSGNWGWYVYGLANGRAVARNIFLDGNSFRDSASVDKKTLVGEIQVGLVLQLSRVEINYGLVFRTEEFNSQDDAQRFGSISLSTRF